MLKINLATEKSVPMTDVYFDGYKARVPEAVAQTLLEEWAKEYTVKEFDINATIEYAKSVPDKIEEAKHSAMRYKISFTSVIVNGITAYRVPKDVRNRIPADAYQLFCKTAVDKLGLTYSSGTPFFCAFWAENESKLAPLDDIQYIDEIF